MPHLRRTFPELRPHLREDLTEPLLAALADGRLDAAIVALPFDVGDVACAELFEDGCVLACARSHPLANLPRVEGPGLSGRPMMLLERGPCLQRHALSAFGEAQISEDRSFAATSLPTLVAMVEAGIAEGHDIELVPAPGAAPRRVALAWRRRSARAREFGLLAGALRTAARTDG